MKLYFCITFFFKHNALSFSTSTTTHTPPLSIPLSRNPLL